MPTPLPYVFQGAVETGCEPLTCGDVTESLEILDLPERVK